jgi:glucose-1-phosphate cytidylyltransferase
VKCVILAGGRGTRIAEESHLRPKPMIEIGGRPILWHIMKHYAEHGVEEFVVCLGYKGYMIKEYFANYFLHESEVTVDLRNNQVSYHQTRSEPWRVTLVDTGEGTRTGGRVLRVRHHLPEDEPFFVTYGDGLSDIDLTEQLAFHRRHGRLATMTVVQQPARYGSAHVTGTAVTGFAEKPTSGAGLINGGYFVLSPPVLDFIDGDETPLEYTPLERLVDQGQLQAWRHDGFWQAMDTLREKELLEAHWATGQAPWKVWT